MNTKTATNVALAELSHGVRFRIDRGAELIYVGVEHAETSPASRITYRDPSGHPAHTATIVVDPAAVEFTIDTVAIPAEQVRPGDFLLVKGTLIRVDHAYTTGRRAPLTTVYPLLRDPHHFRPDELVTVQRRDGGI